MTTKENKTSPLTQALLETANDMHGIGILENDAYEKITMRHFGTKKLEIEPLSAEEICKIREQTHMSQSVFAHCLNVTVGYISQLERGAKRPTGAALMLLNVIQRKGIEAIL
ncbi:MAG: helix-turn-helix domain-containing protein [Desulfuromonadales bacterium]